MQPETPPTTEPTTPQPLTKSGFNAMIPGMAASLTGRYLFGGLGGALLGYAIYKVFLSSPKKDAP
jgi:hypothetical protein